MTMYRLRLLDRSLSSYSRVVWMGTETLDCDNAYSKGLSTMLLELDKGLLVLLYFGPVMTVLTADPVSLLRILVAA